jgi:hypothetical protein
MEKTYQCRPMFFNVNQHIYIFFGLSMLICWMPVLIPRFISYSILQVPFDLAISLSFTLFMAGLLVMKITGELQKTFWIITPTGIIYKQPYRVTPILFSDIQCFTYQFSFLHGRIGLIKAGKKIIRLPFVIHRLHGLISDIEMGLIAAGNQGVIKIDRISRFKRLARIIDLLLGRLAVYLERVFSLSCLFIAANVLIPQRIWFLPLIPTILWIFISILIVVLYLALYVLIFAFQRIRLFAHLKFLLPFRAIPSYALTGAMVLSFYLAVGVIFKAIVFRFY